MTIDDQHVFDDLPPLPDDLAEAFEAMKLAILRHKHGEWVEIGARDVWLMLDALNMQPNKRMIDSRGREENCA